MTELNVKVEKTDLTTELAIQQQWRLRPAYAGATWFDAMLRTEFRDPEETTRAVAQQLAHVTRYAQATVPWYAQRWSALGASSHDFRSIEDLVRLPILTKQDVIEQAHALTARTLPAGVSLRGVTKSSGTTGRPVLVPTTDANNAMFSLLSQRQYRMYRFDPSATFGRLMWANDLAAVAGGLNPDGATVQSASWRFAGPFFETGPETGFNASNPVSAQLAWLENQRPGYLLAYSGVLERLAYAAGTGSHARFGLAGTREWPSR
ncbi:MAG: hypothetical protein EXR86_07155 [Gammaproteobacteria bacterium]|nr:hypothetical protein [Gammaproteobacteria bacterium]